MATCNNDNIKKNYRRDRPYTAIGTGTGTLKIESLITRLSNIENNSNLKTLSAVDWILDDNDVTIPLNMPPPPGLGYN
jgi:hypothetical protein